MKHIIGLVGGPGTGKDTVASLLGEITGKKVEKFSFSRILIDEYCAFLDIPPTHANLQYIGDAIRPEWLHQRALQHIKVSEADYIVIPSIRRQADFDFVQSFQHHTLIGLTVDEKDAYERMRLRNEKPDEDKLTWEEYQDIKNNIINAEIPLLLEEVQYLLENNGSIDELREKLRRVFYE